MRRREFIAALGGAAAWPMAARAQQPERMRRIGVLMGFAADHAEGQRAHRGRSAPRSNWAGPMDATSGSTIAGPQAMSKTFANTRRSWSYWRRMSSWPWRCVWPALRRPGRCRSCSRTPAIQSVPASSVVAAGRQRHRLCAVRIQLECEMGRTAQANRAGSVGAAVLRDPAVTSGIGQFSVIQSGGPVVGRRGGKPDQPRRRRRRDRARRHGRSRVRRTARPATSKCSFGAHHWVGSWVSMQASGQDDRPTTAWK